MDLNVNKSNEGYRGRIGPYYNTPVVSDRPENLLEPRDIRQLLANEQLWQRTKTLGENARTVKEP